ncbi:hypothetical protein GRX01_11640 [Halobaculum sp. WSA2]|uniref:Uncharacterized protein n=1 Tax=Halobaculum saliterrae TaxID=2073113 RepID=A0A6B0STH3_9EURY|nr:hypothetical protein [Halobaculum saliterrae]MXR41985.1 hypothetical protein [Halobaculum saliterrae]
MYTPHARTQSPHERRRRDPSLAVALALALLPLVALAALHRPTLALGVLAGALGPRLLRAVGRRLRTHAAALLAVRRPA